MTRSRTSRLLLAATIASATLMAASGAVLADGTVAIEADRFAPATVTIAPGEKVTWRNDLASGAAHTATADDSAFDTGPVGPGQQAQITFVRAGSFGYTCQIDPSMKGTVVVAVEPQATPTPTPSPSPRATRKPPPTDLAADLTGRSGGTPSGPLLGLLISIVGLGAIGLRSFRTWRSATRRWAVLGPGEAPRRGSGRSAEYAHADLWITNDRPRD